MIEVQIAVASGVSRLSPGEAKVTLIRAAQDGEKVSVQEGISGAKVLWQGTPLPTDGEYPHDEIREAWAENGQEYARGLKKYLVPNTTFVVSEYINRRWVKQREVRVA